MLESEYRIFEQVNRVEDYPCLQRILDASPLKWDVWVEGQRVVNGIVVLGMKAGPLAQVQNLCHELCHYAEIEIERCNQHGWGLGFPQIQYIPGFGDFRDSFKTPAHHEREMRVWAFQSILHEMVGIEGGIKDLVSSSIFLPDLFLLKDYGLKNTSDETVRDYFEGRVRELAQEYTLSDLLGRIEQRNAYIRRDSP